jgi:hypothetical protein
MSIFFTHESFLEYAYMICTCNDTITTVANLIKRFPLNYLELCNGSVSFNFSPQRLHVCLSHRVLLPPSSIPTSITRCTSTNMEMLGFEWSSWARSRQQWHGSFSIDLTQQRLRVCLSQGVPLSPPSIPTSTTRCTSTNMEMLSVEWSGGGRNGQRWSGIVTFALSLQRLCVCLSQEVPLPPPSISTSTTKCTSTNMKMLSFDWSCWGRNSQQWVRSMFWDNMPLKYGLLLWY